MRSEDPSVEGNIPFVLFSWSFFASSRREAAFSRSPNRISSSAPLKAEERTSVRITQGRESKNREYYGSGNKESSLDRERSVCTQPSGDPSSRGKHEKSRAKEHVGYLEYTIKWKARNETDLIKARMASCSASFWMSSLALK